MSRAYADHAAPALRSHRSAIRVAQLGLVVNAVLAGTKLAAGVFGHTYALVADAVESGADILASAVVWGGLAVAARPPDEDHPYGHGKAESLAAAVVVNALWAVTAAALTPSDRRSKQPPATRRSTGTTPADTARRTARRWPA